MSKINRGDLLRKIKTLPIGEVIKTTLDRDPSRAGMNNDPEDIGFLCPFHEDRNGGNFHIFTDKKGLEKYHCFVCDRSVAMGDAVDFVKNFKKCSFNEAVLTIAVQSELITPEEFQEESGKKFTGTTSKIIPENIGIGRRVSEKDPKFLHLIYSQITKGSNPNDLNSGKLSDEDLDYLHKRGISDEEIKQYGYFTFPKPEAVLPRIFEVLKKKGFGTDALLGVPGFWREKKTGEIKLVKIEGIGIPLRNPTGLTIAIQVRARGEVKGARYKFLSSSFTSKHRNRDICEEGCGPAFTTSVVKPIELINTECIAITEGQFKAAQFALNYKAFAITVQGVNNTKDVIPYLQEICKRNGFSDKTKVLIGFDMDMYENLNVFAASVKLRKALEQAGFEAFYLNWPEEFGKGLDDCILNEHRDAIKATNAADYEDTVFINLFKDLLKANQPDFWRIGRSPLKPQELSIEYKSGMKQKIVVTPDSYVEWLKMAARN